MAKVVVVDPVLTRTRQDLTVTTVSCHASRQQAVPVTVEHRASRQFGTGLPEVGMAVVAGRRGEGIGRAMLMHLLDRHPTMSLSVDTDNVGARNLYESLGFVDVRTDGTSVTMIRRP